MGCSGFFLIFIFEINLSLDHPHYTETELVAALRTKDQHAFSYLYDHYAPALNGVVMKMIDDENLAQDILQDAFVKIWTNIPQYQKDKGRLFTWMLNITRNLTIDTLRSKGYKKQKKISGDENFVLSRDDGTNGENRYDGIGIKNRLAELTPDQRLLIDLAYFSGYTQDEISKETGIPLGTVKTRMRAAILSLRKLIQT
jgi:RNA polymerase sigma factor (sigma-70 family)